MTSRLPDPIRQAFLYSSLTLLMVGTAHAQAPAQTTEVPSDDTEAPPAAAAPAQSAPAPAAEAAPETARTEITTEAVIAPPAPKEEPTVVGIETAVITEAPEPTPPPPLKVGASFMTRYEARAGDLPVIGNRPLNTDALFYRARLSLTPTPIEFGHGYSSTVYFEPQASGMYRIGGDPLQDIDLDLHQGYLRVNAPCYTLDVGRFEMIYGDHLMIGNVGWHQTGRAFNGGRLHIAPSADSPWLDLFATLNHDGTDLQLGDPHIGALDHYLVGAYAGLGPLVGMELDFYLLTKIWTGGSAPGMAAADMAAPPASVDPAAQLTFGTRLKGDAGVLDYRAEAGVQFGARKLGSPATAPGTQPVSVFAYQADAELGVKPVKGLRFAAHGFIASGDDPTTEDTVEAWDQHYPTAHKFLGLTDVFGGRSNVVGGALHASLAFTESLKANADGHMFLRPEAGDADALAGSEVDVGLAYAISPALSFRGLYGVYLPNESGLPSNNLPGGGAMAATDKPQHFVEVELLQTMK